MSLLKANLRDATWAYCIRPWLYIVGVIERIHAAFYTHVGMIHFLGHLAVTRYARTTPRFGGQIRQRGHRCNTHEGHGN